MNFLAILKTRIRIDKEGCFLINKDIKLYYQLDRI